MLDFKHFLKHIVFIENSDKSRNKEIKNYINVSVVIDIECGDTIFCLPAIYLFDRTLSRVRST
ncbi:hypothetical protein LN736_15995 [Clostridium sp. WLY-B-L2]|uniref:Uncharacterized protein n=1 Tax=Clostridium aromativorans TaxID=2836848 RepID=A0ABS8N9N6_9CLOT|nr:MULTISPECIES: hypothetical protein [Clostridium]KAA8674559.1 hypothetical protein F3O63_07260 [Clostridium sp. HV4-5-A1G]MCC9296356.1 hypothetical protein [Clostridium aromativorans]